MPNYTLGISAHYHDSAACLLKEGELVAAAEEERFSRLKHDSALPINAIRYCLREAKIEVGDLSAVAFYEKPWLKLERILETQLAYPFMSYPGFLKAMPRQFKRNLRLRSTLKQELGYVGKILFPEHHQSHAASAFYPSPYEDAAILTLDGVGEWATTTIGTGEGSKISLLTELRFPHSLGLLYSAFTAFCGFKVNSGEYKLMGLAAYGEPRFRQLIYDHFIDAKADGSFRLRTAAFNFSSTKALHTPSFFRGLEGPPRLPEAPITPRFYDIAASIQKVIEECVLNLAQKAHALTGKKNLCLSGGVALNGLANGRVLREGPFENIWVQPAAGDAGAALGAAYYAWHQAFENPRNPPGPHDQQQRSYLGPEYGRDEILNFLKLHELPFLELKWGDLYDTVSSALLDAKIIGWFQGRMEFGPRALGNRSILSDPRPLGMRDKVNAVIKMRENFRPFGASILMAQTHEYFDLKSESPYMLLVANAKRGANGEYPLPAVTHADGTSRLQTVTAENGRFYELLNHFYQRSQCPAVLNTSFNLRGEPIVNTLEEAYACFRRSDLDALALGNFWLTKRDQPPLDRLGVGIQKHLVKSWGLD